MSDERARRNPLAGPSNTESERDSDHESNRNQELILISGIFALAALIRAIPIKSVLTSEGIIFSDGDAYSHMWRIWNAASKSISLSARDPFVNFPQGGEVVWSPAFDWIVSTMIRWLGLDQAGAELFCAWVPLILGASAVALAASIASRTFSRTAGWVTGIMLAVLPGSFLYTKLGALDHHAAITLIGTAMLGGAMRIVSADDAGPRSWPVLGGALCSFGLVTWAGALLHVGILQIAILTWALGTESGETARARTLRVAVAHAVAALTILPFSLRVWEIFGDFNPLVLTRFQPTWFASGAICLMSATMLWRIPRFGDTRVRRLGSVAAIGTVGLCLAFALIPELSAILSRSASWFTTDVESMTKITELAPLFEIGGHPFWWGPMAFLSPFLFVLPLAMIAVGWRTSRPERWLLLFWTAAFCALSLTQFRFVNTFSVALSIVCGGASVWIFDRIGRRTATVGALLAVRTFVVVLLAAMLLIPSAIYYAPRLQDGGFAVINFIRRARSEAARSLAASRPVLLDEDGMPTAGVLCVWSAGHEFRYYSGWPVHQDGFGPYVSPENARQSMLYYAALDEDVAIDILRKMGTRYVLADVQGGGQYPYSNRSMTGRMVRLQGSGAAVAVPGSRQRQWIPALTRHRLVVVEPNGNGGAWIYEAVRGAVVVGSAAPGSRVVLELQLDTPSGKPRTWTTVGHADAAGSFRLRVPYATIGAPESAFAPLGPYRLRTRRGVTEFDVPEASVQDGRIIRAPTID